MKPLLNKFFLITIVILAILVWTLPRTGLRQSAIFSTPSTGAQNIDLKQIPLGDGRISTAPTIGSVWSCRPPGGDGIGGAHAQGQWIHADGTYDLTAKPTVDGNVQWPSQFKIVATQEQRTIVGNRLPQHLTGKFPIDPQDDAYAFDRNPNTITPAALQFNLPTMPKVAVQASCLPMGEIGVLVSGSYFFNALDAAGQDAVAHEIQDSCQGHPEITGAYHYHSVTTCLDKQDVGKGHSRLLGYALDGFGIYGHRGQQGKDLINADLDECHGHTHQIDWEQRSIELYHYHATWEYPYTLGCFRGEVMASR
jgi:hypothetical protein